MRWLHFILSHSIFIAFCALALCYQTNALLHISGNIAVYVFVFFATLCSYNFYWLISKYSFTAKSGLQAFALKNRSYIFVFVIAATGMFVSFTYMQQALWWVLLSVGLTLIYSMPLWPFSFAKQLRRAGFLKTTLLAFTWSFVTVVLPAQVQSNMAWEPVLILLTARFFFMLMLCTIFDRRDAKMDKIHSLHSLATDVSKNTLRKIMVLAFVLYMAAGLLVRYYFNDNIQLLSFVLTGAMVWIVYRLSLKEQGYVFYYFIVDGLMFFTAFTTFIASIIS